jgi:hypothetical protein
VIYGANDLGTILLTEKQFHYRTKYYGRRGHDETDDIPRRFWVDIQPGTSIEIVRKGKNFQTHKWFPILLDIPEQAAPSKSGIKKRAKVLIRAENACHSGRKCPP